MSRNLTLPKWEIKLSWKFRVTRWLPARFSHLSRVRSSLLPDKRQVQGRNASCFPVQRLLIEPRLLTISFRLVSVLPKTKHLVSYRSENFSEFVIASLETKAYFRTLFISKLTNLNDSVFKPFLNAFFQASAVGGAYHPCPEKSLLLASYWKIVHQFSLSRSISTYDSFRYFILTTIQISYKEGFCRNNYSSPGFFLAPWIHIYTSNNKHEEIIK